MARTLDHGRVEGHSSHGLRRPQGSWRSPRSSPCRREMTGTTAAFPSAGHAGRARSASRGLSQDTAIP
eukprot:9473196-Pyramimonas_sp.AAC.1